VSHLIRSDRWGGLQPAKSRAEFATRVWPSVGQPILAVRMGLRPMKGDKNLAEVQLSRSFFDARTGGRAADRANGESEAFDRVGGLQPASARLSVSRRISRVFAAPCLRDTKPEKICTNCASGRFSADGGLKGRLQARLPAPPGDRFFLRLRWGVQSTPT
jgi:hypothetical protein